MADASEQAPKGEGPGPVVRLERVSRVFRDFWGRRAALALSGVSLEMRPGEIYGLIGPNGSGKTTCLKLIIGLLRPTSGRLEVLGRPPGDRRSLARIGYLPEDVAHFGFLDAREGLDLHGRLFGMGRGRRRERSEDLIRALDLEGFADRPAREYSRGMAQRLGIAQALVNDPDLLVLDEPTSGLDVGAHRRVREILRRLRDRGKAVLLSSHLLSEVGAICDRIGILAGGRMIREGPVPGLLREGGVLECQVRGIGEEVIRKAIRAAGGEVGEIRLSPGSLEDLFLRAIGEGDEDESDPGDRGGDASRAPS